MGPTPLFRITPLDPGRGDTSGTGGGVGVFNSLSQCQSNIYLKTIHNLTYILFGHVKDNPYLYDGALYFPVTITHTWHYVIPLTVA